MGIKNVNPNQLKMFMTPREIEASYQPLDGDRQSRENVSETRGTSDTRAGALTGRAQRTDGANNVFNYQASTGKYMFNRPSSTSPGTSYHGEEEESDDDVWDRKLDESHESSASGYNHDFGGGDEGGSSPLYKRPGTNMPTINSGTWIQGKTRPVVKENARGEAQAWRHTKGHTTYASRDNYAERQQFEEHSAMSQVPQGNSMADSIATQGVLSPIRLGSQFGSSGKKQIVGGHHRMAVARDVAPDTLVPVLHHNDIHEARSPSTKSVYKYT